MNGDSVKVGEVSVDSLRHLQVGDHYQCHRMSKNWMIFKIEGLN